MDAMRVCSSTKVAQRGHGVGRVWRTTLRRSSPRRFVHARVVAQATSIAVTATPAAVEAPNRSKPMPFAQTGQHGSPSYGSPMRGRPEPLGATLDKETGATNFAVVSSGAYGIKLVLFSEDDLYHGRTTYEIPLDPELNRTGDVWHILLPNLDARLLYGYRVSGPNQTRDPDAAGHRFDDSVVILDPYAKAILSRRRYGELGPELDYANPFVNGMARTWPQAACVLPAPADEFDWEGDKPLNIPMEDLVIYEMHVRGFTIHSTAGVQAPGTYLGMVEKLDYIKSLGINAVELLPVQEFNELEYYAPIPGGNGEYRFNFWGYSTIGYFSPMSRYSYAVACGNDVRSAIAEFKTLVKECHRRGIEVILDVVFNHTAEGNEQGPTLAFRGLDNRVFYMLAPGGEYYNYSGCGNTLNCNQPVVRQFVLDCLRYWVTEFHVDGFRFDLASILTRAHAAWHPSQPGPPVEGTDGPAALHSSGAILGLHGIMSDGAGVPTGTPLTDPPLVEMISEDPILKGTKLIAEAWDCDGLNQVGAFPHYGGRWSEWNGHFRDSVRQFLKGMDGPWAGNFASALCGSPNIYASTTAGEQDWWANNGGRKWKGGRGPSASINFVTAHDGFTLADLVSYNEKHNDANGEGNRDGEAHNLSWNCGAEGPSTDQQVNRLRQRQMRNLVCALLLSHGVPMLQMGDEYGHSKNGNNNTYCHDSYLNQVDWSMISRDEAGFARFVRRLVHFRKSRPELCRKHWVTDNDISWHGEEVGKPDWSDASRLVAFSLRDTEGGGLYVAFNTAHLPRVVQLPLWHNRVWQPLIDTGRLAPFDFLVPDEELSQDEVAVARAAASMWTGSGRYPVLPWSCVVLTSEPDMGPHALRAKAKTHQGHVDRPRTPDIQEIARRFPRASGPPPATLPPRTFSNGAGSEYVMDAAMTAQSHAEPRQAVQAAAVHAEKRPRVVQRWGMPIQEAPRAPEPVPAPAPMPAAAPAAAPAKAQEPRAATGGDEAKGGLSEAGREVLLRSMTPAQRQAYEQALEENRQLRELRQRMRQTRTAA